MKTKLLNSTFALSLIFLGVYYMTASPVEPVSAAELCDQLPPADQDECRNNQNPPLQDCAFNGSADRFADCCALNPTDPDCVTAGTGQNPNTQPASPYKCGVDGDGEPVATSIDFECSGRGNGIEQLLLSFINLMAIGVGIAVVAGITVGGIMYSTSQGNEAQTEKAVKVILNSVIGLILYFLLFALTNFLIPGGIFT